jgi:hypothetical protein
MEMERYYNYSGAVAGLMGYIIVNGSLSLIDKLRHKRKEYT